MSPGSAPTQSVLMQIAKDSTAAHLIKSKVHKRTLVAVLSQAGITPEKLY